MHDSDRVVLFVHAAGAFRWARGRNSSLKTTLHADLVVRVAGLATGVELASVGVAGARAGLVRLATFVAAFVSGSGGFERGCRWGRCGTSVAVPTRGDRRRRRVH